MSDREQELRELDKRLSEATNEQLVLSLMSFAKTAVQAQNAGALISGENGLEIGSIIFEYIKRTDKTFKEVLKETD